MGKSLILSLQNGKLAAAVRDGADVRGEALFPLEEDHSAEIAAMAAGAKFALCPGGVLRPLSAGVYALDAAALADARENRFGPAPANRVMERCAETAERMGIPAYFTEAMSVDELLPLNRIRSHAEVHKYSRGFRSEHFAAMEAALGDIRPEDGNYIVAWIDDLTSVGAYQRGRCLDINDCIGAEGPMGFTSSGDVPCAQLAKYFAAGPMSYEELQEQLLRIQREMPRTIVLVTHQLDEALLLGERIIVMHPDSTVREFDLMQTGYPRDLESAQMRELKAQITAECRKQTAEE